MTERVNTVLIASGSGTDADSIMKAYVAGCIPNINLVSLVSTKSGAGCIEKAISLNIPDAIIHRKMYSTENDFNYPLRNYLQEIRAKLVFLVGCVVKIFPIDGIDMYNMHPADPHKFGGKGMYGLEVHRRVVLDIVDRIKRGKAQFIDDFFTLPTIHRVTMDYDSGESFLQAKVNVPMYILGDMFDKDAVIKKDITQEIIDEAASNLQQIVLPYEWIMLPAAVKMAAKKIIDERT